MKNYPSIPVFTPGFDRRAAYHVFDKLDGSNLRAEWSPKQGFYKFGTRTRLLGTDQPALWPAKAKFLASHADALDARFRAARLQRALAFFEYVGPNSFAGSHTDPEDQMSVVLFDIAVHQKGLLEPAAFLAMAEGLPHAKLLHHGPLDEDLIQAVRSGQLPGMTFEGVVVKGAFERKLGGPVQFKIKNQAWLARLKAVCGDDEALFERLS